MNATGTSLTERKRGYQERKRRYRYVSWERKRRYRYISWRFGKSGMLVSLHAELMVAWLPVAVGDRSRFGDGSRYEVAADWHSDLSLWTELGMQLDFPASFSGGPPRRDRTASGLPPDSRRGRRIPQVPSSPTSAWVRSLPGPRDWSNWLRPGFGSPYGSAGPQGE